MKARHLSLLALGALCAVTASAENRIEVSSVSPMPNSVISQFNYITMVLSNPTDVQSVEVVGDIKYQVASYDLVPSITVGFDLVATRSRSGDIRIGFSDATANEIMDAGLWPVDAPGCYTVNIAEGALKVTDSAGNVYTNDAMSLSYDLIPPMRYESVPADGSKEASINDIQLDFPDFERMIVTKDFSAKLVGPKGEIALGEPVTANNILQVPLADGELTAAGDYTFTLAARSLDFAATEVTPGQINPAITVKFSLVGITNPTVVKLNPEQGVVESLAGVSVIYNMVPHVNKECTAELKVYRDDVELLSYNNTARYVQFAIDNDDPNTVLYTFSLSRNDIFMESGKYRIEVPQGFMYFMSAGQRMESDALTLEYEILPRFDYTVTPRPGNITSIDEIKIAFPDATKIERNNLTPNEEGNGIIIFSPQDFDNEEPVVTINGNEVTFKLSRSYSASGRYTLLLPFNAFTITDKNGYTGPSQGMSFSYVILNFPAPTADPAPGEYYELGDITFTLDSGLTYGLWLPAIKSSLKKVLPGGTIGDTFEFWGRTDTESVRGKKEVTLSPVQGKELVPGDYVLTIGRSTFSVDVAEGYTFIGGFNNGEIQYYYTILADESANMEPEYADGHEFAGRISEFKLYFPNAETVEVAEDGHATVATADGASVASELSMSVTEGTALTVKAEPEIVYNGEYLFTIPAGALRINSKANPEYQLHYSISGGQSGVDAVLSGASSADVYGIDGTVVLRGADAKSLSSLPAGMYIISGKKVMIRK